MKKSRATRLAAVLLSLILIFTLIPGAALAAGETGETLVFVHTNDVHGHLEIEPYVKAVADSLKAEHGSKNVVTVSAGDIFGAGLAIAHLTGGESVVEVMNAAEYDYIVPGNGDMTVAPYQQGALGYGDLLVDLSGQVDAAVLAANFTYNGSIPDTMDEDGCDIFTTSGGTRVGVFGISATIPDDDRDLRQYGYYSENSIQTAKDCVAYLEEQGCDVIVCITHMGWTGEGSTEVSGGSDTNSYQIAAQVPGIDLLIDGHSHSIIGDGAGYVYQGDDYETLIVQASYFGNAIGVVKIELEDNKIVSKSAELLDEAALEAYDQDPVVLEKVEYWQDYMNSSYAETIVGQTAYFLNGERKSGSADGKGIRVAEQNLGNLVTDALRYNLNVDVAMFPGFLIRASIAAGDITLLDLYNVFGSGGKVFVESFTAKELWEQLEENISQASTGLEGTLFNQISGLSFVYDPETKTVLSVTMADGAELDPEDETTVYEVAYGAIFGDVEPALSGYAELVPVLREYLASENYDTENYYGPEGRIAEKTDSPAAIPFSDVTGDAWYYDAVAYVYENGLFTGTSATTFEPKSMMTREMFITVLSRLASKLGEDTSGYELTFSDVDSGRWYSDGIAWGAAAGIVLGYDGDTFGLGDYVTREQMAAVFIRFTEYMEIALESVGAVSFDDASGVSEWASDAVAAAAAVGLFAGENGSFYPQRTATRAEAAQLYLNFGLLLSPGA